MEYATYMSRVGTPVTEVPPVQKSPARASRALFYAEALRAGGLWVPIQCDSEDEARDLGQSAKRSRTMRLTAEQRGTVCYLKSLDVMEAPDATDGN